MSKEIAGKPYCTVPEAAKEAGVSRTTMYRWAIGGVEVNGEKIEVLRDPISNHLLIAKSFVSKLAKRYRAV